jgi:dihydropteroate synthase
MGILNLTPDSFSDGGRYRTLDQITRRTEELLAGGAQIIDVGGVSTRPQATPVTQEEELDRLLEPLAHLITTFPDAFFSVDTYRAGVASQALALGAHIINDITGGRTEPELLYVVAQAGVPYVLTHSQGDPYTHANETEYDNLSENLWQYFVERINTVRAAGIQDIILDPGFGFSKTIDQNYVIFKTLEELQLFHLPVLIGISRKSMLYKPLGLEPLQTEHVAAALHLQALRAGVRILRTHEPRLANDIIDLYSKYLSHT